MARRVLLADDSTALHRIVKDILQQKDIEVQCVENGEEALRSILESPPGLVLADLNMPRMGGFELCELMRREPNFEKIPVIFLVGPFDEYDEKTASRVGGSGHLIKPFDSYRLLAVVNEHLPHVVEEVATLEDPEELAEVEQFESLPEEKREGVALDGEVDVLADLPEPMSLLGGVESEALPEGWVSLELSESERDVTEESGDLEESEKEISALDVSALDEDDRTPSTPDEVLAEAHRGLEAIGGPSLEAMIRDVIREEVSRVIPEIVDSVVRQRIQEIELEIEAGASVQPEDDAEGAEGEA